MKKRGSNIQERSKKIVLIIVLLMGVLILIGIYTNFHKSEQEATTINSKNNFAKEKISDDLVNIPVGANPTAVEYNFKSGTIGVIDNSGQEVTIINGSNNKIIAHINTGFHAASITADVNANEIVVEIGRAHV